MRAVRDAAERYGYMVMSSYNTVSDGSAEPNVRAFDAMITDAQSALSLDSRRLYLVGFSGTARTSWNYAFRLGDHVAGVLGAGAGVEPSMVLPVIVREYGRPFVFFGTAGDVDFNYEELRTLDTRLDELEIPNRIVFFDGGHQWPPADVYDRALEWFEIQAIRQGLRSPDMEWVTRVAARRLEEARTAEEQGRSREALRLYRSVAEDFPELPAGDVASDRVQGLEERNDVRDRLDLERRVGEADAEFRGRFWQWLEGVREGSDPEPERAVERLRLVRLVERAEGGVGEESKGARRLIEYVFVVTGFYEPARYLGEGDLERARGMLEVADFLKPNHPTVCYGIARVLGLEGHRSGALDALACAVAGGAVSAEALQSEAAFETLRDDPEFEALVERARASG
jgi:predicted esterase